MRVLLLGFGKIAYMPYMNFYLDALSGRNDIVYDLIYWDRDGKPDSTVPEIIKNVYKYEAHLEEQLPFKSKLKYFYGYRKFAMKMLRNNRYDRIVVLHTTPGLTLLDYLRKYYKGRYILDFRDISYEYIPIYRMLVGKLSQNAAVTFVSSNAFRKFLPSQERVYTIHNYLEDSLKHIGLRSEFPRRRDVLRISYWGLVRHATANMKIIDALGNDPRFELHYYGRMQQAGRDMEAHAKEKSYSNVFFHGSYMPTERYTFAAETDLIHNIYALDHTMGNAMGNKYYDGIIFEIPQICTEGSHMGDTISERGVGVTVDLDNKDMADILWNYYQQIDWEEFIEKCNKARELVLSEQAGTKQRLLSLFE